MSFVLEIKMNIENMQGKLIIGALRVSGSMSVQLAAPIFFYLVLIPQT